MAVRSSAQLHMTMGVTLDSAIIKLNRHLSNLAYDIFSYTFFATFPHSLQCIIMSLVLGWVKRFSIFW